MKLFLVTLFVGIATAGKLQNSYIPPSSAGSAGGQGSFLQGPSSQYLPSNNGGHGSFGSTGGGGGGGSVYGGHQGGGFGGQGGGFGGQGGYGGQGGFGGGGHHGPQIPILRYENINNGDGSYHFDYATGNGITQNEHGHLNNAGSDYAEQVVAGSYSYTGDDGHTYTVNYKADSNGFQASGDHLPTPPPIPEAILKSLEYNAAHPEENNAGGYGGGNGGSYGGGSSHGGSFGGGSSHGGSFGGGGSQGGSFGGRPQQQYLPPQQGSGFGGQGGSGGYHY